MLRIGLLSTLVLAVALGGAGVTSGAALAAGTDFAISVDLVLVTVHAGTTTTLHASVSPTPNGSFSGTVTFQVSSGLPAGASATVVPTSSGADIVLSSSTSVPVSAQSVTVTGTGGGLTRTTGFTLMVVPPSVPFAIFAASSASVTPGSGQLTPVQITGTNVIGFTGVPTFTATGLPAGVTAMFQDTTPFEEGVFSNLLFSAASTATPGTATITVTGFAGSVTSLPITISLTVTGPQRPDFSLGANTASVTLQQGSSGTVVIGVGTAGGFTGTVTFGAGTLPNGVTASFNPTASATGSTLTLTASPTATTGSSTVTVTGTSGSLSHTVQFGLTVNPGSGGGGTGGLTATPVVSSSGPYFNEEDLKLANTASLTSLSITIVVQRTTGLSFNGEYNTVGGSITQSSTSTASAITYQFNLAAGSTLAPGSGWTFAVQTSGSGTAHATTGDTFTVTYTTGGTGFTRTGHF